MSTQRHGQAIGVLGHYHGRNLGDDLVVATIVEAIRRRLPDATLVAISLAPGDSEARHGIRGFPINPSVASNDSRVAGRSGGGRQTRGATQASLLKQLASRVPGARKLRAAVAAAAGLAAEAPFALRGLRLLRGLDAVVIAGSGQLDAGRGTWDHPTTIFRWALLCRLTGTRLLVPSIGAGPIEGRLGRILVRRAVAFADAISVRDAYSAQLLHAIGVERPLPVRPDMGYAFPIPEVDREPPEGAPRVGINIMAHEDPRYFDEAYEERFRTFYAKMVDFTAELLDGGYEVVLFSTQTSVDALVAEDVLAGLARRGLGGDRRVHDASSASSDLDGLVETIQSCDYVIASRFHAALLSIASGIPVLGLAYHPKTRDLLEKAGHPDWCLDIESFAVDDLLAAFEAVQRSDSASMRQRLRRHAHGLRAVVETQFDELLGPLGPRRHDEGSSSGQAGRAVSEASATAHRSGPRDDRCDGPRLRA